MKHKGKKDKAEENSEALRRATTAAPQWPSYTGTSQFAGTSPSGRVNVYVDPTLGAAGIQNAHDLVNDADRVVNANDGIFGTTGGPVSIIVFALGGATDGTGGADHMGCDYTSGAAIEVCAAFGSSARVSALFEAELSECSMGGNLCGESTGEALSRWCAAVIGNNALADFATAPQWVKDGKPDFVNKTDPTDQSADSTGCGMAFISWLISQGHGLGSIAQGLVSLGDGGTFAQLYGNLSGQTASKAWPAFQTAIQGLAKGVTNDDPFGGLVQPPQPPKPPHPPTPAGQLTSWTVALAGKVFAAIVTDLAAGKTDAELVADVRAVIAAEPAAVEVKKMEGVCAPKSHRLRVPDKF